MSTMRTDGLIFDLPTVLAQASPAREGWERYYDQLAVLVIVVVAVALGAGVLGLLRGRQTPPEKMPRYQRWLLLVLIAVFIGGCVVMLIRATT